jgi:hypothetical protein
MPITVSVAADDAEFSTPPELKQQDWTPVIEGLAAALKSKQFHKGSKPLRIDGVVPDGTLEKNMARALSGAKRSLSKALSKIEGPNGKPLSDFLEVGYLGKAALGIRFKP